MHIRHEITFNFYHHYTSSRFSGFKYLSIVLWLIDKTAQCNFLICTHHQTTLGNSNLMFQESVTLNLFISYLLFSTLHKCLYFQHSPSFLSFKLSRCSVFHTSLNEVKAVSQLNYFFFYFTFSLNNFLQLAVLALAAPLYQENHSCESWGQYQYSVIIVGVYNPQKLSVTQVWVATMD